MLDFIYLKPKTSGIGYLIVLAGIPVYLIWQRISDSDKAASRAEGPNPRRDQR